MNKNITNDQNLAALMRPSQAGDADAYVQLMEEITPHLRRIVKHQRQFLAAEDIEDLVQDILLSLHVARATYDPQRPFTPWLLAIARNRLVDNTRRYMRQAAHEVHVDDLAVSFPGKGTNTNVEVYGDPDALKRAVDSLPRGQREAVEMLKLREMSLKEAATATGMSVGALKIATHRAMNALRARLRKA